jgi:hypothetical protein
MPEQPVEFDFLIFHDLGHSFWQCVWECWLGQNMPGGWQRHLKLSWEFIWEPEVHAQTTCRIGRHTTPNPWWRGQPHPFKQADGSWSREPQGYCCGYCRVSLPAPLASTQ